MDYVTEILKWLPQGGAAGAVIVVVILFLKQQDKMAGLLLQVSDKFTKALEDYQHDGDEKLRLLTGQYQERYRLHEQQYADMQAQMTALVREQIAVNTKMTTAIEGLQRAVTELQEHHRAARDAEAADTAGNE